MKSVLLIDDEPLANHCMRELLAAYPEISIVGIAESLDQARELLNTQRPDVVFLDVEMPGGHSFSVLPNVEDTTQVVFVTAHQHYAVEAFAVGAVDYLVKPVNPERLDETIRRLTDRTTSAEALPPPVMPPANKQPATRRLTVPLRSGNQKAVITIADICWIESLRNYTRVALQSPPRVLIFRRRLSEWLDFLPTPMFIRISRSEVIQLQQVIQTEWKSRSETLVFFGEGVEPILLGRSSTLRLNALLAGSESPLE
jgi:two-component system LytT family response regulator